MKFHDNLTRLRRAWEAKHDALAAVRQFNARLSAKGTIWSWPTGAAALTAKHPWLVIACDICETVVDLDLRLKRRDPEASIRTALRDVRCPRCNGNGRPRIVAAPINLTRSIAAMQSGKNDCSQNSSPDMRRTGIKRGPIADTNRRVADALRPVRLMGRSAN